MCFPFPQMPEKLTSNDKSIVEYIARHHEEFLFMTIGQLADSLHISEATISRFARHVGCEDFKHLKQVVMNQTLQKGPAQKLANTLMTGDGKLLHHWIEQQQYYLQKTLELLDETEFDRAVNALASAKRVFIHAKNASQSLAQLLHFRLRRIGIDVHLIPSGGTEMLEGLVSIQPDDLVVLFGLSKVSSEVQAILDYQNEIGYSSIMLTGRLYSSPNQQADINLFVYRGEENEYHSMSTPSAVIDALVIALSDRLGSNAVTNLNNVKKLKNKYGKYL